MNPELHVLCAADDGYVTKEEAMGVYETVVEDGQKGRFVCGASCEMRDMRDGGG